MGAGQFGLHFERLFQVRFGGFGLAFLDQRAGYVDVAIDVFGLRGDDLFEGEFGSLNVALQQHADAPIVPSFAIRFLHDGLPDCWLIANVELSLGLRQSHDWQDRRLLRKGAESVLIVVVRELPVIQFQMELDRPFGVLGNTKLEVSGVGGAGRNEAHKKRAAGLPGVAFVDVISVAVQQIRTIEVRARIDGAFPVVGHFAAPEYGFTSGVNAYQFQPHIKGVDRAAGEKMADFPRADDGVEANGVARLERDRRTIQGRGHVVDLTNHHWAVGLRFFAGSESGGQLRAGLTAAAASLNGAAIADWRGGEEIDGDETGLQEFLGFSELDLVVIDVRHRRIRRGEPMAMYLAVPAAGIV